MSLSQPCVTTQKEISNLIKSLKGTVITGGPHRSEQINAIEKSFNVKLPSEYRLFIGNFGSIWTPSFVIFGLGDHKKTGLPVTEALLLFRLSHIGAPKNLIPIEDIGEGCFACLVVSDEKYPFSPVVGYDIENPTPLADLPKLSNCFSDYLFTRLNTLIPEDNQSPEDDEITQAWSVFEKHILKYHKDHQYDHATGGKLPRNHEWRPYRYCIQDVLFGVVVVQHLREANCLNVDVFLTAEIPEYGPLAGAKALASFLLSEAYKCGGTMEIRFTNEVENGKVPQELQLLAEQYDVVFEQDKLGRISPAEAKALYAAVTDFSPPLQEKINQLEKAGRVKMARACYVVNHGVWTKEQVEMIVLGSEFPDSVLGGMSQPDQWVRYQHDLLHARAALLTGMFERLLEQRIQEQDGIDFDLEDDRRHLEVTFDGEQYTKRYLSQDPMPLPSGWLHGVDGEREIPERTPFHVLIRARDVADLHWHLSRDIQQAINLHQQTGEPAFILLPNDFYSLTQDIKDKAVVLAQSGQVGLLICPDSVLAFDAEAAQKLARSRVLRQ